MSQIALPLKTGPGNRAARIVIGAANAHIAEALAAPENATASRAGIRRRVIFLFINLSPHLFI